jgi:hypothetical protein
VPWVALSVTAVGAFLFGLALGYRWGRSNSLTWERIAEIIAKTKQDA